METQRLPGIATAQPRSSARRSPRSRRRGNRTGILVRAALGAVVLAVALLVAGVATDRIAVPAFVTDAGVPGDGAPRTARATWTAEVVTDALNVRDSASLEAAVIGSLSEGQRVTVTGGNIDGFVPVAASLDGAETHGWVASAYLQPVDGSGWATDPDHGAALDGTAGASSESPASIATDPGSDDGDAAEAISVPTTPPTLAPTEVPTMAPTPAPTAEPTGERWIDVDRTAATVTLFVGETAVARFPALIGRDPSPDGFYATAVGTFHVYSMDADLSPTPFVDDVYLTDWVGFDPARKNGFHSPVRNADGSVRVTGGTVTMGCVRLGAEDAKTLYAFAEIGMRVEIHD